MSTANTVSQIASFGGQLLMGQLPGAFVPVFGGIISALNIFSSIYGLWNDYKAEQDAAQRQNLWAQFERDRYDLQSRIQQGANYMASSAIIDEGYAYVNDLQDAFIRAGVSSRSGTAQQQLLRITHAFKRKALLARVGL
jgi:hypothetical protein